MAHPAPIGTPGVGTNLEVISADNDVNTLVGTSITVTEVDGTAATVTLVGTAAANQNEIDISGMTSSSDVAAEISNWLTQIPNDYQNTTVDSHISIDNNSGIVVSVTPAPQPDAAGVYVEPHHRIFNLRSSQQLASDVATAARDSIVAGHAGVIPTIVPPNNRLQIVNTRGANVNIERDTAGIDRQGAPLSALMPLHQDLVRVVGQTVSSAGPLGIHATLLQNAALPEGETLWNTAWMREEIFRSPQPQTYNNFQGADGPYVQPADFPAILRSAFRVTSSFSERS